MKILTNHPGRVASASWRDHATNLGNANDLGGALKTAVRLFRHRHAYDCVVLGGGRSDLFYALIQRLLPFSRKPIVMIDCLWYEDTNPVVGVLRRLLMQAADGAVARYCVWASREIDDYSRAFGLPRGKFVFVPYHTTLEGHELETRDEGYLFAGGNWARDYPTLIAAVTGLPVTLHIASTRPELFAGLTIPPNVIIRGYSHSDYLKMMANCSINVVPLASGLLHSGGQQTFLNSMWMGKPTIVADPEGARDYIEDGLDGLLVPPGDVQAMRQAIVTLVSDPTLSRRIGDRARQKVTAGYSTDDHFKKIIALASDVVTGMKRQGGLNALSQA